MIRGAMVASEADVVSFWQKAGPDHWFKKDPAFDEEALIAAMLSVRRRGGIIVVVTHRPTALAGVDLVAVMIDGRLRAFGPKEDVMQRMTRQGPPRSSSEAPMACQSA